MQILHENNIKISGADSEHEQSRKSTNNTALKDNNAKKNLQPNKKILTGSKAPKRPLAKWGQWALRPDFPDFQTADFDGDERRNWVPIDYFFKYFDNEFFQLIDNQTNINYFQQKGRLLKSEMDEIKRFVGITLAMSALGYPRINMYWKTSFRVPLIADHMTRDRFFVIRNYLHLVNNLDVTENQREEDRLWKVRPLLNRFRNAVLSLPREENV